MLLPFIPVLLWASAFVVIRHLKLDPMLLTASRLTVSALIFLCFLYFKKQLFFPLRSRQWILGFLLLSSLTGFMFYNLLVNYSLQYLSAGMLATLVNTLPLISVFLGYVFFKEKITLPTIIGGLIAFLGVVGMTGVEISWQDDPTARLSIYSAIGTALTAALSLGVYFSLQKKLMGEVTPAQASGLSLALGVVMSHLLLLAVHRHDYGTLLSSLWEVKNLVGIVYLGGAGGFLGFLLWNITLKRFPMGKISNILFLVPPLALLGETVFLGREFLYRELGFMALILGGVFIATQGVIPKGIRERFSFRKWGDKE